MDDQESNPIQSPDVYGYAWVENSDEALKMLDIQTQTLLKEGVKEELIFTDVVGSIFEARQDPTSRRFQLNSLTPEVRPGWHELFYKLKPGDTVCVVPGYGQDKLGFYVHMNINMKFMLGWAGIQVMLLRPSKDILSPIKRPVGRPRLLNESQVQDCRRMRAEGASLRMIAKELGYSAGTVKNVVNGVGAYAEERLDAQG